VPKPLALKTAPFPGQPTRLAVVSVMGGAPARPVVLRGKPAPVEAGSDSDSDGPGAGSGCPGGSET
jgi:hypothetical protein